MKRNERRRSLARQINQRARDAMRPDVARRDAISRGIAITAERLADWIVVVLLLAGDSHCRSRCLRLPTIASLPLAGARVAR